MGQCYGKHLPIVDWLITSVRVTQTAQFGGRRSGWPAGLALLHPTTNEHTIRHKHLASKPAADYQPRKLIRAHTRRRAHN